MIQAVLAADVERELADRFEERQAFDVADGAADLGDDDVDVVGWPAAARPSLISSVTCGMTWTVLPVVLLPRVLSGSRTDRSCRSCSCSRASRGALVNRS